MNDEYIAYCVVLAYFIISARVASLFRQAAPLFRQTVSLLRRAVHRETAIAADNQAYYGEATLMNANVFVVVCGATWSS